MVHPVLEIARFMHLGGQHFPETVDRNITTEEIDKFLMRVDEEAAETYAAIHKWEHGVRTVDIPEALDGFIDTAYAALTGAIRLVGPGKAAAAWNAVVDANLAKVDGRHGPAIIHPETGKIGKPEGWIRPDIEAIVEA